MTIVSNDILHGLPFKVIDDNGALITSYANLQEAQEHADRASLNTGRQNHYSVYEVKWCGGSKRLGDLPRK